MIPIVMSVDVTSFKFMYNLYKFIVLGLIFDIGGNKLTTKKLYRYKYSCTQTRKQIDTMASIMSISYRGQCAVCLGICYRHSLATKVMQPWILVAFFLHTVASFSASDFVIFDVGGPLQSPVFFIKKRRMT